MIAVRVVLGGRRMIEQLAKIDEMLLRGRPLGQRDRLPFADEFLGVSPGPVSTKSPGERYARAAAIPRQSTRLAKYTSPDSAVIQKLTGQSE